MFQTTNQIGLDPSSYHFISLSLSIPRKENWCKNWQICWGILGKISFANHDSMVRLFWASILYIVYTYPYYSLLSSISFTCYAPVSYSYWFDHLVSSSRPLLQVLASYQNTLLNCPSHTWTLAWTAKAHGSPGLEFILWNPTSHWSDLCSKAIVSSHAEAAALAQWAAQLPQYVTFGGITSRHEKTISGLVTLVKSANRRIRRISWAWPLQRWQRRCHRHMTRDAATENLHQIHQE